MDRRFAILVSDEDDEETQQVAEVSAAADDRLTVVSAEPDFAERVQAATAALNAADELFRVVPSPSDSPRYTLEKVAARRGSPDFLAAIRDNLERFHGLILADG
jgi:hypothetical protein